MKLQHRRGLRRQTGIELVEFSFVAMIVFLLLFAIIEFGRYFYVSSTVQEVTRRAARAQIVAWVTQTSAIQKEAVFQPGASGTALLPAGAEVTSAKVNLSFYNTYADAQNQTNAISYGSGSDAYDNFNNCLIGSSICIQYVRASLQSGGSAVNYVPMVALLEFLAIPLPGSTVIVPAEALGLL